MVGVRGSCQSCLRRHRADGGLGAANTASPAASITADVPIVRTSLPLPLSERSRILSRRHQGTESMRSCCSGEIHGPRVAIAFGGMHPAAARWNKLCWSAARSPPSAPADGGRGLAPPAFKMSPLSGLSSLPDHNFTIRANLNTVLLRVSESPWFNLSFAFMHTGSKVYRMALPVRSMRLVRPAKDSYLRALPMSRSCLVKESGAYCCWIASSRSTKSG